MTQIKLIVTMHNYNSSCMLVTGYIGCNEDVLDIVDASCSGRQHCEFPVLNLDEREDLEPCLKGLEKYLDASYTCVSGLFCLTLNQSAQTYCLSLWYYLYCNEE